MTNVIIGDGMNVSKVRKDESRDRQIVVRHKAGLPLEGPLK